MDRRPDERIEVEPLSDARWARIERSLLARLDGERLDAEGDGSRARGAKWRAPAAFVVASAIAAAIGALASRALWAPGATASHMQTGASGSHLVVGEAAIDVAPRSEILVSGDEAHGVLVVLARGGVDCEVAPRRGRPPFVVQAGGVRVRVVGTRFAVSRDEDDVRVDVAKGVVEVAAHGETESVAAGAHWPREPATPIDPSAPPIASAAPLDGAVEGPALPRAPTPPARRSASPVATALASAPEPRAPDPSVPSALVSQVPTPRVPTVQERFEGAARLESSDPAAALATYRAIAASGADAWAANALYAAGRLQADRGVREDARALLEEYLARFPRGSNAPDARDLLSRVRRPGP